MSKDLIINNVLIASYNPINHTLKVSKQWDVNIKTANKLKNFINNEIKYIFINYVSINHFRREICLNHLITYIRD